MKMSKTPISILQEFLMKNNRGVPIYDYLGDRCIGNNSHEFTIRVTSGDLLAEGKGPTKKDAKQDAANKMLLIVGNAESQKVPININSLTIKSTVEKNLTEINGLNKGTNYIGLLHEYCAQRGIIAPIFTEVNIWGPSHLMNFTIRCKVSDINEEATATTKKQAKTEAAKKVWLKVSEIKLNHSFDPEIKFVDLDLEKILPDYKKLNKVAEDKYLQLTKLGTPSFINDRVLLENCHQAFSSDRLSISLRKSINDLLNKINIDNENILLIHTFKSILDNVAKLLNVKFDKLQFTYRELPRDHMSNSTYLIGFKLHTQPTIVSISSANNSTLAELKAIFDVTTNLKILIS